MNRGEYLNTLEGQKHERWKRRMNLLYLRVEQEPQGKKAINRKEKEVFRTIISEKLKKLNRKAFRGDIILQFDFFITGKNPPALQSLCKNYLDLLHKSMPEIDQLKGILFRDDSQVKILIANYHTNYLDSNKPRIEIKAYRLSNFYKDLEFADGIYENRFTYENEKSHFYDYYEEREYISLDNQLNVLRRWISKGTEYSEMFGTEYYRLELQQLTRRVQEQFLQRNRLFLRDLIMFSKASFIYNKKYDNDLFFQNLWSSAENMIFLALSQIELTGVPLTDGGTKSFKSDLKMKLNNFKEKYSILFPLLHPISLIIFYTPPKRNPLDLDNLARYVIPLVTEIFKPPATEEMYDRDLFSINKKNDQIKKKGGPQNKINDYQILYRPRKEDSPDEGFVNILISDGMSSNRNIWETLNVFLGNYENS